ncbi:MAG: PASTA domain-containing protein [Deltaproteobacteria bacterium]|nr:PASTA domain-containing protein [Deltaproteobacteria bacterium]
MSYRRPSPSGRRSAVDANTKRLRSERQSTRRRVDAVVTPDGLAFRTRTGAVLLVFGLVWAVHIGRAAYVGLGGDERLVKRLHSQHERVVTVAPQRGSILDRLGRPLAVSVELGSAYADPSMVEDPAEAARLLAPVLGAETEDLEKKLNKSGRFVWLGRQIDEATSEGIRALGIDGVRVTPEAHREYPSGTLAAQVLGFVGTDGDGLEGLEARYDSQLMGDSFRYTVLRDRRRRATNYEGVLARRSTEGQSLVLTLDHGIQHRAEMSLDAAVERHEAKAGFAMVMDANTGALLAVASNPRFDPNSFRDADRSTWKNLALSMNFEPGSTMKSFVVAEALERDLTTPDERIYCEKGRYKIGRNVVHDSHPEGWLTMADVVKKSSNVGTVKLAERLGPADLEEVYRRFGFGSRTGVDLYGEEGGILHSSAGWARITFATHAFGQGVAVTGLQMASAYCALINGGTKVRPHVLAQVRDIDDLVVEDLRPTTEGERVISEETSAAMRPLLERVLEKDGTGWRAAMGEYTAGGKTGTAQKVKDGRYAKGLYVSSFIGFAPVDEPKVVTYVVLDEPMNKYYGGTVAGPVFREVTAYALRSLGVPPDKVEEPEALAAIREAEEQEAEDRKKRERKERKERGGDAAPPADSLPTLVADAGGWILPDLSGLSGRDAVALLAAAGLAPVVNGTGLVASQEPAATTWIASGDTVRVSLDAAAKRRRR